MYATSSNFLDADARVMPMDNAEFVEFLYETVMRRPADEAGREYWIARLDAGVAPSTVLDAFLDAPEFLRLAYRHPVLRRPTRVVRPFPDLGPMFATLPPVKIVDVGAQMLAGVNHVYAPLAADYATEIIGFDPLQDALDQREASEPNVRLFPYALGDGKPAVLYETRFSPASSLLRPNLPLMREYAGLAELCEVVARRPLATVRLDDVPEAHGCHFLKLDVQGAELSVLSSASNVLDESLLVHIEVSFASLYVDQPLFGDVDAFMRQSQFAFVDFTDLTHYTRTEGPTSWPAHSTLLWGEAVYVKSSDHAIWSSGANLLVAALAMHTAFQKYDLASHYLGRYDQMHQTELQAQYAAAME
jgi:FkbM family methyltransferase